MKIIHITNCLRGGGIQNFLLSLLPEQVKEGHHVELIVIESITHKYSLHLSTILNNYGVDVIVLNKKRSDKISLLNTLISCRKKILNKKPNVINTHGEMSHIYGAFSVLFTTIPHCITIHNAPEKWDRLNCLLNAKKPLIFCSKSAFTLRAQKKSKHVVIINNGISPNIIKDNNIVDLRKELNLLPTNKIVVLVGSLRVQKNYDFLKEIVDELNNTAIHFCICGGNYGKGYISIDSFKKYPTIHFLGLRSDVSAIENGADLFLSCATFEGLPIAVLEAYFNGIPCVLSPIPQHKNIANVYKVYVPDSFNAVSFSKEIKHALSEVENHDSIYEKRKDAIAQYGIANACKRYIDFYKEVLNGQ